MEVLWCKWGMTFAQVQNGKSLPQEYKYNLSEESSLIAIQNFKVELNR